MNSKQLPALFSESVLPCREGGLEPARLAGLELGFDPFLEPPGVRPVRIGVYEGFLGVYRLPTTPILLSLSLRESGVDAESDERLRVDDIATDFCERSRTYIINLTLLFTM